MLASIHNPLVKHLVKLRENRQYREKQKTVLISGFKLIKEVAQTRTPLKIFVENLDDAIESLSVYQVTPQVLKKITGLPSPEPIAAEFELPAFSNLENKAPLLVLDAIRDPGNVGTLMRTALALGWAGVFFLPTCVDPLNDKVIRSSRAALFRLPFKTGTWDELSELKKKNKLTAYIADMQGKDLHSVQPENSILLILSNEAQGVCREAASFGQKISIPMEGKMESLNVAVAGAILMYSLKP